MVELTVLVEPLSNASRSAAADEIARTLQHAIKTHIGTTCRVEVRAPGSIERSIGKARRIVDERGTGRDANRRGVLRLRRAPADRAEDEHVGAMHRRLWRRERGSHLDLTTHRRADSRRSRTFPQPARDHNGHHPGGPPTDAGLRRGAARRRP